MKQLDVEYLSAEKLNAIKHQMMQAAEKLTSQSLGDKRQVTLNFKGMPIDVLALNPAHEVELRCAAFVKARADPSLVPPLPFEVAVFRLTALNTTHAPSLHCMTAPLLFKPIPYLACFIVALTPREKNVCYQFDASILKPFGKMREVLIQLIRSSKLEGPALLEFLKKKTPLLQSLDASCCIELAVMQGLLGEGGVTLMQNKIVECLPSKSTSLTIEHSMQLLTEVQASGLYTFTSADAQRTLDAVKEMLIGMLRGKSPKVSSMRTDPFMTLVADQLPYYCIENVGDQGKQKKLAGADAIRVKLDQAERARQYYHCFDKVPPPNSKPIMGEPPFYLTQWATR